ncbi:unnamed protein product [Arabidopsis thaliana]|uniref:Uncharacterized protein n=1 Tax=Arabidopsis thaliana TaxID=3702 RepID=A0A654FAZ9_ARATH|nr:unnamed protein product [Arabidopsis thaliana]
MEKKKEVSRKKYPSLGQETQTRLPVKGKEDGGLVWSVKNVAKSKSLKVEDSVFGSISVQTNGISLGLDKVQKGDSSTVCAVEDDSSDVLSTDTEEEAFIKVLSKRQKRNLRGKGLKTKA